MGHDRAPVTPRLQEHLHALGTPPAAINLVVLSHADFDHIGGTLHEGGLAFSNARHVLLQPEFDYWATLPDRLSSRPEYDEIFRNRGNTIPPARLALIRPQLELVADGAEVHPGFQLIHSPGHTPGYAIIAIESNGERLWSVGDQLYRGEDIADPAWFSIYDENPMYATSTRQRLFAQAAKQRILLMAYHLPFPGLGYVSPFGQGWQWQPLMTSAP